MDYGLKYMVMVTFSRYFAFQDKYGVSMTMVEKKQIPVNKASNYGL